MRTRKEIPTEILQSINALNTIHGGISEPWINIQQLKDHRQINAKVPGVDVHDIQIEVVNNVLNIFHFFPIKTNGQIMQTPRIFYSKQIPYFIDQENIEATVEDNQLKVFLPFNNLAQGYKRKIELN